MKTSALFLLLVLVMFSQSAKAQNVYRDYDSSAALAKYKSFAWMRPNPNNEDITILQDAAVLRLLEKAISEKLNQKVGIKQTADAPDLFIACYVFNKDRRQPLRLSYDESQLNLYTDIRRWQFDGNLIVDLVDRESNRLVWRGVAVRALVKRDNPQKQIHKAVNRLFNKYPASQKGWQSDYGKVWLYQILVSVGVVSLVRLLSSL